MRTRCWSMGQSLSNMSSKTNRVKLKSQAYRKLHGHMAFCSLNQRNIFFFKTLTSSKFTKAATYTSKSKKGQRWMVSLCILNWSLLSASPSLTTQQRRYWKGRWWNPHDCPLGCKQRETEQWFGTVSRSNRNLTSAPFDQSHVIPNLIIGLRTALSKSFSHTLVFHKWEGKTLVYFLIMYTNLH